MSDQSLNVALLATNTLILAGLLPHSLWISRLRTGLQSQLTQITQASQVIILPGLQRIILVFEETRLAVHAYQSCDFGLLLAEVLVTLVSNNSPDIPHWKSVDDLEYFVSVFYGQHTIIGSAEQSLLPIPESTKNFLLSPPTSPPMGWTQHKEGSPCTAGHEDLLDSFTLGESLIEHHPPDFVQSNIGTGDENFGKIQFDFPTVDSSAVLPSILITACDGDAIHSTQRAIPSTALPPV